MLIQSLFNFKETGNTQLLFLYPLLIMYLPDAEATPDQESEGFNTSNTAHSSQLLQEEYEMRQASLNKQFELKLAKQKQYYELREWKLGEEKRDLQEQIKEYQQSHRRNQKQNAKEAHCQICSDGEVIKHLQKVLHSVESNHNECLSNKKQMLSKIQELSFKVTNLQAQNCSLEEQNDKLNKQIRSLKKQRDSFERQLGQKNFELGDQEKALNSKTKDMETLIKKLKEQIHHLQNNVEYYRCKQVRQPSMSFNAIRSVYDPSQNLQFISTQQQIHQNQSFLKNAVENLPKTYAFKPGKQENKTVTAKDDFYTPYEKLGGISIVSASKMQTGNKQKQNMELKFKYL